MEPEGVVRRGYDTIGARYLERLAVDRRSARMRYLDTLLSALQPGSAVLDLGCGPGFPVTHALAKKCNVVAVDVSGRQLALARRHAPAAAFLQADLALTHFREESFDAVAAFYSLTHVPRGRHASVLSRVETWLRPGGLFLATMGAGDTPGAVEDDWLGVPMYFSHFDAATNLELVRGAGLHIEHGDVVSEVEHDGREVAFLWVVARKTASERHAVR